MNKHPVALVGYKQSDNLGVGYLASVLSEAGYDPKVIDIDDSREDILKTLKKIKPEVVGFSVIFQYNILKYIKLVRYLRNEGIKCHFTAGGYYASLRFEELFKSIPSLDSIVRFEGEYTLLELVNCIHSQKDWRNVKNIVFRDNGRIVANPLRPPENDLDNFPFPLRSKPKEYAFGKKFATIIAGRGCTNNCSFCNNMEYNKKSSGPIKRTRNPEKVVEEISFLHHKMDCSVFLFQDDDFPIITSSGSEWINAFCKELKRNKLNGKIMWKINCRPDEIDYESFSMMKNHGLFLVFLGIDDGTDIGLTRLNKHMSVAESLKGINILKRLEIGFDYGFMLFQPTSTFGSINDNLDFLRLLCGDGYTPVIFLKLRPYFDTRVERELRKAGRLKGKPGFLDYDFLDESLNHYYKFTTDCFADWLTDPEGLVNISRWIRNYVSVFSIFFETDLDFQAISGKIKEIISESNLFLLDTMEELSTIFKTGKYDDGKFIGLSGFRRNIKEKHDIFKEQIIYSVNKIYRMAEYQSMLQLIEH